MTTPSTPSTPSTRPYRKLWVLPVSLEPFRLGRVYSRPLVARLCGACSGTGQRLSWCSRVCMSLMASCDICGGNGYTLTNEPWEGPCPDPTT